MFDYDWDPGNKSESQGYYAHQGEIIDTLWWSYDERRRISRLRSIRVAVDLGVLIWNRSREIRKSEVYSLDTKEETRNGSLQIHILWYQSSEEGKGKEISGDSGRSQKFPGGIAIFNSISITIRKKSRNSGGTIFISSVSIWLLAVKGNWEIKIGYSRIAMERIPRTGRGRVLQTRRVVTQSLNYMDKWSYLRCASWGNHEKEGGALRSANSFIPFNDMIRNSGLLEFPARGNKMSWQGRRGKGKGAFTVRCRLDRALANEEWHTLFPVSYTEYLGMVGSDHRPVVAFIEDKVRRRKGQFRFDKRWIGQEGLLESIASGWKESGPGIPEDIVSKISNCRHEIAAWRKNNPLYGKEKIAELQKALEEVQSDDSRSQEEIFEVSKKLQDAYKDEEEYWHQKSRNMWYSSGDLNTNFYHALTRQRRIRNRIVGLYDETGTWITDADGVEKVAVDYFGNLFTTTDPSNFDNFLDEVTPAISSQMNQRLLRVATEEEVKQALFMMHPEKAPGPDGMTALFFQISWHIIKDDLVELVNSFLTTGEMDPRLNLTNICMIPKTERPTRMTEGG
ncbi:Endonuclease/exonuclease/phosphatase protein [Raphanus sativus]|nr:Endonuclease/exonuclease/phosphatase protein [Raphanus sativus]